jgi:cation diffusion facilitator CzcD-associated flavoprotein CzcO
VYLHRVILILKFYRFKNEVANNPGWQRERMRNFHQHFTTGKHPKVNLVNDQWTHAQGMVAVAGNPLGPKSIEELPEYLKTLHSIDLPRTNRIRDRVMEIVKDSSVAEKLQPWYPTWCKRPAFHDDYLQTFNEDNVTLLDTAGKGPDGFTKDSIVVGGDSYPVDIVIFATGFRAPYGGTPAEKANATIIGRNGISMTQEWARNGPSTLRGLNDHNFPNLFLSGPWQASLSGNNLFNVDIHAKLASYILAEARQRSNGNAFAVTPTAAAVEDVSPFDFFFFSNSPIRIPLVKYCILHISKSYILAYTNSMVF